MDERRECGEPHALAHLAEAGRGAHDMRVIGPSKSAPLVGARHPFGVLFFGCLAIKFRILTDRYKDLNGMRVFRVQIGSRIVIGSRTRPYIRRLAASITLIPIFTSAHNCVVIVVLFISPADVHLRLGEQVSRTLRLRDPAPREDE
jgi:hypothetical protein